jgi:pimeloyl-ACP methyl ester carboxylesterase
MLISSYKPTLYLQRARHAGQDVSFWTNDGSRSLLCRVRYADLNEPETAWYRSLSAMDREISYGLDGCEITLALSEAGAGPSVVLLPALSSISTCEEMRPLLDRLAPKFHVVSVDWPGFGSRPRPRYDWSPAALSGFLDWFLTEVVPKPHRIIAAGHAATYAIHQLAQRPGATRRLVLIAPTWRGPLPTVMNGQRSWFARIRAAMDSPIIGPLLYRINVSRFVISKMARGHVYDDPEWLSGQRLAAKIAITRTRGARYGSVRFVTGSLDPLHSRESFLDLARRANVPILLLYGDRTPRKSRAEMEALAQIPGVRAERLPRGKLGIHEEFPDSVADVAMPFLSEG